MYTVLCMTYACFPKNVGKTSGKYAKKETKKCYVMCVMCIQQKMYKLCIENKKERMNSVVPMQKNIFFRCLVGTLPTCISFLCFLPIFSISFPYPYGSVCIVHTQYSVHTLVFYHA